MVAFLPTARGVSDTLCLQIFELLGYDAWLSCYSDLLECNIPTGMHDYPHRDAIVK